MMRRNFIGLATAVASWSKLRGAENGATPILSFGLITDVQYADADPEGERHYRQSIPKLKVAAAWLTAKRLPFTLHLGDIIDRDFTSFAAVMPLFDGFGHPVRHLLGNHDYAVKDGEKGGAMRVAGIPGAYYQFSHCGVRFVMLDTSDLSTYKYPAGSPRDLESKARLKKLVAAEYNGAKRWNGGISEAQLKWLDDELTAADAAKQRVILCGHHPLLPAAGHQTWNSEEVLAVIDRHPAVAAYLNGHNHAGGEVIRHGVPFITFKSILHEPEVNAFSAIHLFADRMEIEGNGREQSRVIPLLRRG